MEGQRILIYGLARTGKSTFVKKVNGIEENNTNCSVPNPFPTIYVYNEKPVDDTHFDIVLQFTQNGATFEKGLNFD
jgi:energy-coupling factor transporter ATP-binding protein EcfA2